jgi:uncharacterized coiled-coil protein SlyX
MNKETRTRIAELEESLALYQRNLEFALAHPIIYTPAQVARYEDVIARITNGLKALKGKAA